MVLRATLRRISRIASWLLVGSLFLATIALGFLSYILVTTPWYDGDCIDYECRDQSSVSPRVGPRPNTGEGPAGWDLPTR